MSSNAKMQSGLDLEVTKLASACALKGFRYYAFAPIAFDSCLIGSSPAEASDLAIDPTPVHPTPVHPIPVHPIPAQPAPAQPVPDQIAPVSSASLDKAPFARSPRNGRTVVPAFPRFRLLQDIACTAATVPAAAALEPRRMAQRSAPRAVMPVFAPARRKAPPERAASPCPATATGDHAPCP